MEYRTKKYKHKLNMLEPGYRMIKAIGILGAFALIFFLIKEIFLSFLFGGLAAMIGIILWILLIIEHHQDRVLYDQDLTERRKNGEG
jgi:F0F1-type ATP synthase assembly protein I